MTLLYYFTFGLFNLGRMCYEDIKNNRMVDQRLNYVMMGIAISILSHVYHGLLYTFMIGVYTAVVEIILKRIKVLGDSDINSIRWMTFGVGLIGLDLLIIYVVLFSLVILTTAGIRKYMLKTDRPQAFYPSLVIMWLALSACYVLLIL